MSTDELGKLRAGQVVVRASQSDAGTQSTGLVLIDAAPAKIWQEVFDYGDRVPESGNLVSAAEYGRSSRWDWGVTMAVSVVAMSGELNLRFHWDEPGGWATFGVDPARENVLEVADGYYRLQAQDEGWLLTYHVLSKTKFYVPGFIQRSIAERDMASIMGFLRARSEGE